ncbi:hypothetical protein SAMN05877753_101217 [Bacillus oleivorans]|uniref:Uncharacterized protein n=1 Tax=Bacillus oleivorans TaxID=1448271 RepID=A0A285CH47_9BACI|nr:hypothetical protein [Bacillus oleivorans]SNX66904.1 hypothetical protein SAMN05877753_101217 [Bacillus oleivorans]
MLYNVIWSLIAHLLLASIALMVFIYSEIKSAAFCLVFFIILSAAYFFSGKLVKLKKLGKWKRLLSVSAPSLIALLLLAAITIEPGPMGFNFLYYTFFNPYTWLTALTLQIDPGHQVFIWTWPIPSLLIWLGLIVQKK